MRMNHLYYQQGNINEARRIVENYHLYSDSKFIAFIEANLVQKNNDKSKNYSKLNDPVNLVRIILINQQYDDTLLHYAVFHNKEKLIKYLLDHKADPFKTNKVRPYFY